MTEIPIIVTRKGRPHEPTFKVADPRLLQQLKENRSPSVPRPRNNNLQPRHQTLDPNGPPTASRTRRISSSAAAKRFPKDFFKDENCLHPIKSIRPKHKQHQPVEPCFLDTFSHKHFLVCSASEKEPRLGREEGEGEGDTPKFKQRSEKEQNRSERLRNKVQQLIQETPISKYHTAADPHNKHPLLQIFEPQRQEPLQNHHHQQPFGAVPMISNFNVTLGQKVALSFLMKAQKSKRRRAQQKQNNQGLCPESSRRESNLKPQGFRIRRKVQS